MTKRKTAKTIRPKRPLPTKKERVGFVRPMGVPCVDIRPEMVTMTVHHAPPPSLWAEDVKATRYRCASLLLKLARQIRRVAYRVAP